MRARARARVCVCVCVCVRARARACVRACVRECTLKTDNIDDIISKKIQFTTNNTVRLKSCHRSE